MTSRTIIKIGRGADCQLRLNSPSVSSEHAWVIIRNHTILLIDCGTTNGTRLKSQGLKKISQTAVSTTDTIFFADQEVPVSDILKLRAPRLNYQNAQATDRGTSAGTLEAEKTIAHPVGRSFMSKLIQGDYGLAKTYWLFGVLGNIVMSLPLPFIAEELILVLYLPLLSYSVVVLIAVWRAANRYQGPKYWSILAKIATVLGWIQVAGAGVALTELLS
jgi:hypothetical protein